MEEMRNANKILVGKPEGTRPLGRLRNRWWKKLTWIIKMYRVFHLKRNYYT
jgi:hypothetical protein